MDWERVSLINVRGVHCMAGITLLTQKVLGSWSACFALGTRLGLPLPYNTPSEHIMYSLNHLRAIPWLLSMGFILQGIPCMTRFLFLCVVVCASCEAGYTRLGAWGVHVRFKCTVGLQAIETQSMHLCAATFVFMCLCTANAVCRHDTTVCETTAM
jgi:hypothetical protein